MLDTPNAQQLFRAGEKDRWREEEGREGWGAIFLRSP